MSATTLHRRRAMKSYRARRHALGGGSVLADATPLRPILHDMHARMSWASVGLLVGTTHTHISAVAHGRTKRIHPDLFRRILENSRNTPDSGRTWVASTGAMRRVRALHALGYSAARLAREVGDYSEGNMKQLMRGGKTVIYADTDKAIRDAYERLSMRLPEVLDKYDQGAVTRSRNTARINGWHPPLAWDDIDRDLEPAHMEPQIRRDPDDVDENIVDRLLVGDRTDSTRAEKEEAMRRWLADGRFEVELCRTHGWRPGRYSARRDAA